MTVHDEILTKKEPIRTLRFTFQYLVRYGRAFLLQGVTENDSSFKRWKYIPILYCVISLANFCLLFNL